MLPSLRLVRDNNREVLWLIGFSVNVFGLISLGVGRGLLFVNECGFCGANVTVVGTFVVVI